MKNLCSMEVMAVVPESLGDFLLTTPSLASLEKRFEPDSVTWLLPKSLTEISQLIPLKARRVLPPQSHKPDITLCFPPSTKHYWFTRKIGSKIRVGYCHQKMLVPRFVSWYALTQRWICPYELKIHEVEAYGKILDLINVPFVADFPILSIPEKNMLEATSWIAAQKAYPEQKTIAVHLNDRWFTNPLSLFKSFDKATTPLVIPLFAKSEESWGRKILSENSIPYATPGVMSLATYAAFLKSSQLLLAMDGGPVHLASALKTPVIAFYPKQNFEWHVSKWHPWKNESLTLPISSPLSPRDILNFIDTPTPYKKVC